MQQVLGSLCMCRCIVVQTSHFFDSTSRTMACTHLPDRYAFFLAVWQQLVVFKYELTDYKADTSFW